MLPQIAITGEFRTTDSRWMMRLFTTPIMVESLKQK